MAKEQLLLADSNEDFRQELKKALSPFYRVLCCGDGKEALRLLRREKPAMAVIDPLLPELDGVSVLQLAAREDIRPITVLTGVYFSVYTQEAAFALGVAYLLQKPCDLSMTVARIRDVEAQSIRQRPDNRSRIRGILLQLDYFAKHDGFSYLAECVVFILQHGNQPLTKVVYPAVGKQFGCSWKNVERSIRSATEIAWKQHSSRLWQSIFGEELLRRPSNSLLIRRLVLLLQQEKEQE